MSFWQLETKHHVIKCNGRDLMRETNKIRYDLDQQGPHGQTITKSRYIDINN
jgi:hypothetical protein